MALRFIDGFDHYTNPLAKWSSGNMDIITSGGRLSGGYLRAQTTTTARTLTNIFDNQQDWYIGAAFYYGTTAINSTTYILRMDHGTQVQCGLRILTDNTLDLVGGNLVVDTYGPIPEATWVYLELGMHIANVSGTVSARLNGVEIMSFTGDTDADSSTVADRLVLTKPGSNGEERWDDLYVCDGTGGAPSNTFLGDIRVETLYPNGNGNSSVLVGSDGNSVDNYLLVDEASVPDDDTTYVESSTVGDKDTYAMTNLTPTTGTVYGVQPIPWARKTDAGTRSIVSVARLSGTEVDSSDKVLTTSYAYYRDIRETKPGGGSWSITDVNNAEFGVKVTA